jgi:hypothetical protein
MKAEEIREWDNYETVLRERELAEAAATEAGADAATAESSE